MGLRGSHASACPPKSAGGDPAGGRGSYLASSTAACWLCLAAALRYRACTCGLGCSWEAACIAWQCARAGAPAYIHPRSSQDGPQAATELHHILGPCGGLDLCAHRFHGQPHSQHYSSLGRHEMREPPEAEPLKQTQSLRACQKCDSETLTEEVLGDMRSVRLCPQADTGV